MKVNKFLMLIVLLSIILFPFYAFSDISFLNDQYSDLKYFFRYILFFILLINYKHLKIFELRNSSFKYYIIYIFLAILSVLFSADKTYSLIKIFEVIIILLTSIVIVNKYTKKIEDLPKLIIYILGGYIIGFVILGNTIYPSLYRYMGYGGTARLGGGLINPNLLGFCLLILILSFEYLKLRKTIIISFIQIALIFGIYLTLSRSVILILTLFLIYKFIIKKKINLIFIIPALVFILTQISAVSVFNIFSRGEGADRIMSFSGRLPIWQELISLYKFDVYSFFGRGFQMISDDGLGKKLTSFGTNNFTELTMAHNNILQVLYGMGILGLIVSILVFFKLNREIRIIQKNRLRDFLNGIFWILTGFSMVEFGVYGSPNILVLIFSIIIFSTNKYVRPKIS